MFHRLQLQCIGSHWIELFVVVDTRMIHGLINEQSWWSGAGVGVGMLKGTGDTLA